VSVYDFARDDQERISQMQEASLSDRTDIGVVPNPLVGGPEWWEGIRTGERPQQVVEGQIADAYWASMGDWPELRIRSSDGSESTWTREGNSRRYVSGLAVRLTYVEHPWKKGVGERSGLGAASKIVLSVEVEDSPLRSAAVAPGPGGHGYTLSQEHGDVVHYLAMPTEEAAVQLAAKLGRDGFRALPARQAVSDAWFVRAWHRDVAAAQERTRSLVALAAEYGGTYDGGEVIASGGEVWGPAGPGE
jgi:hypothetical protein